MSEKKDIRHSTVDFEVRELPETEETVIRGYALKFDKPSEDLGFIEYLDTRCLDKADMSSTVALLNHDSNFVLGRVGRNLDMRVDETGLYFEIKPTNTSYTRDLIENMRNGLIDKCSFAFSVAEHGQKWERKSDKSLVRTITQIEKLYDVSVVTTPAYRDTEAMLSERSEESFKAQIEAEQKKLDELREIEIMDMELEAFGNIS